MKYIITVSISLFILSTNLFAQYEGSVPRITSGYGANGIHNVSVISFPSPLWSAKEIVIFYPSDIIEPVPVIFYSHGFRGNDTTYVRELYNHIASRGYALVYSPYKTYVTTNEERYNTLFEGFKKAIQDYPNILDSSRCGFIGHSFGGGATPEMAQRAINNGWGENGKFLFMMAPWYSLEISQEELENFPIDANLIVQVYDNDATNDHRIGIDIFNNIRIPDSLKDFIVVSADTIDSFIYEAGHSLPSQYSPSGIFDAYDYYAVFRLLDALADFTFTGNQDAKNVALGNGSFEQIDMGPFRPLYVTDNPQPQYPQDKYKWPCDTLTNPRRDYCTDISDITNNTFSINSFNLSQNYPNPFNPNTTINFSIPVNGMVSLTIYNTLGEKVDKLINDEILIGNYSVKWNASNLPSGIYLYQLRTKGFVQTKKLLLLK